MINVYIVISCLPFKRKFNVSTKQNLVTTQAGVTTFHEKHTCSLLLPCLTRRGYTCK